MTGLVSTSLTCLWPIVEHAYTILILIKSIFQKWNYYQGEGYVVIGNKMQYCVQRNAITS